MVSENSPEEQTSADQILFADFLERTPPGTTAEVKGLFRWHDNGRTILIGHPDIQLHCNSDTCEGTRFFVQLIDSKGVPFIISGDNQFFLRYRCRNCRKTEKLFAIVVTKSQVGGEMDGVALKVGEVPSFGPPLPSRVITLVGPDRELFIRGRRSENQGLGVGAFAYYRRVVENQKGRLISEIERVAKHLGASQEDLAKYAAANKETQFSKAIDDIKDAIPPVLLINGHNPLKLLHSALSEGLHAGTDKECLELATSIRVVLTELAERISQALKDEAELRQAISKLMQKGKKEA